MNAAMTPLRFLLVLGTLLLSLHFTSAELLQKNQHRQLEHALADHTNLLFRSLDLDHDQFISAKEFQSPQASKAMQNTLKEHLPGVSKQEFMQFLEMSDQNQDKKLSRTEFTEAVATGLKHTDFVEVDSSKSALGFLVNLKGLFGGGSSKANAKAAGDESCVICQYIVERIETNVKVSGVLVGGGEIPKVFQSFLEVSSTATPPSLLEVETQAEEPATVGATRQSTRYQRQLERQKFNEIYRVADITLDDVCEQGMPDAYYKYCKKIYSIQSDVVDGLRYQYRPADICVRTKMCGTDSYITAGIHSRYKNAGKQPAQKF